MTPHRCTASGRFAHRALRAVWVSGALALAAIAGSAATPPSKGRSAMSPPSLSPQPVSPQLRASVIQLISLPDDAFFALDDATVAGLSKRLAGLVQPPPLSRPPGAAREPLPEVRAIAAPTQLDPQRRSTFPILIAEVRTQQREWEVLSRQNRHFVASNLGTGEVRVISARDKGRRMPPPDASGSGTPPDALNAGLSSIGVMHRDVLKWIAAGTDTAAVLDGRLALTLLDYDLPSNTHLIRIGSRPEPASPVPMGAKARVLLESLPVSAGATADGVRMSLAAPAMLKAELRLQRQRVTLMRGVVQPVLLAASLVMVRLDVEPSIVLDLAVTLPGAVTDAVQSGFEIDLSRRVPAGSYQIYLVIGDTVSGPIPFTLKP